MTEVEKEFIEYVKSHNPDFSVSLVRLALKLIARYPQVLAEKVWEGNLCSLIADTDEGEKQLAYYGGDDPFNETVEKVEVFIRETHD